MTIDQCGPLPFEGSVPDLPSAATHLITLHPTAADPIYCSGAVSDSDWREFNRLLLAQRQTHRYAVALRRAEQALEFAWAWMAATLLIGIVFGYVVARWRMS